jgi:hypothetical protein
MQGTTAPDRGDERPGVTHAGRFETDAHVADTLFVEHLPSRQCSGAAHDTEWLVEWQSQVSVSSKMHVMQGSVDV